MNVSAYVCLGDPAWIESSVLSYYPYVTKIVASYDINGRSWSGPDIDVDVCKRRLMAIDHQGKVEFMCDDFSDPANYGNPILSETVQRQRSLAVASQYGDWVLQLDTDEIFSNWAAFETALNISVDKNCECIYYPSVYVYQVITRTFALESCRRWGKRQVGYPAPLCVKSGTQLYHARRSRGRTLHVTCRGSYNTVIEDSALIPDYSVSPSDCVMHITKGRTAASMAKKFATWGHARDRDFSLDLRYWHLVRKFPWLFLFVSHMIRGTTFDKFRLFRIPCSVRKLIEDNTLDGDLIGLKHLS